MSEPIQWKPSSLAASVLASSRAPATTHEPTAPSDAWSASDAASPQPPDQSQRSMPPSPSSTQTSNTSSAASALFKSSGPTSWSRRRFHAQIAVTTGTRNAAAWPNAQASSHASPAPTGPQALGLCQNSASSPGRWNVATLAAESNANAPSSTAKICRLRLVEMVLEVEEGTGGVQTCDPGSVGGTAGERPFLGGRTAGETVPPACLPGRLGGIVPHAGAGGNDGLHGCDATPNPLTCAHMARPSVPPPRSRPTLAAALSLAVPLVASALLRLWLMGRNSGLT